MLALSTLSSLLALLVLLSSCEAESPATPHHQHRAHRHRARRQHGSSAERGMEHLPRQDAVDVVTETVYETTYLGYVDSTTQTTTTITISDTTSTSSLPSVVVVYSSVIVYPVPQGAGTASNTASTSRSSIVSESSVKKETSSSSTHKNTIAAAAKATSSSKVITPQATTLLTSTRSSASSASSATANSSPADSAINPAYSAVAASAIAALSPFYSTTNFQWTNVRGWIAANTYNDIMDFDHYTNSKTFENTYGASLATIATSSSAQGQVLSTDGFNDDQLWWCLAMLRAYQNYGNKALLDQAAKQWRAIGANAQLSRSDQGTTPRKGGLQRSHSIQSTCDVDGAVYWSSQPDSTLNAISTSLYAQVGAQLLALTGDSSFRGPADAALGWLQRMMLSSSTGIMNIDSYSMDPCTKHFGSLTYNTGVYIGALTSLYATTGESTYLDHATQSVSSAVTGSFGNDGAALVVSEEADLTSNSDAVQWRDVLFRNIAEFTRVVGAKGGVASGLQTDIAAFFKANYDQIQSKARFGDLYAANWFGRIGGGSDWGTASVLSCLTGAMLVL